MAASIWYELGKTLRRVLLGSDSKTRQGSRPASTRPSTERATLPGLGKPGAIADSPGQYGVDATTDVVRTDIGRIRVSYAPDPDGDPDPGEVIWTWVPYAENDGRGKDRPVLIIGRLGGDAVVGCYLSTKQHRGFVSVGPGGWDGQGRESFLSPERLLRVTNAGMRREGHVLSRNRFERAVAVVAREHGITG